MSEWVTAAIGFVTWPGLLWFFTTYLPPWNYDGPATWPALLLAAITGSFVARHNWKHNHEVKP